MNRWYLFVVCLACAAPAAAQGTTAPPAPAVRRWLDVQNVHLATRFRWVESNTGEITSSTLQWQPSVRARFLFDRAARYTLHIGAFSGNHLVSGWNNTGGGVGEYGGDFNVKQLFVSAEPRRGLEFQFGGLYLVRGENTDITSYDTDAYVVGERVSFRRNEGWFALLSATAGHFGDVRTPNVFKRFDSLGDINYGQLLVGARLSPRVMVSTDYTYEDGRDLMREGVGIRLPESARPFTALRADAYQRLADVTGQGFNVSTDLQFGSRFTMTAGMAHIDRNYVIPGYMSPNSDRFERGTRFYSFGTYSLTRELSIGYFHGEAFNTDYEIPNEHRFEILLTLNPTAFFKSRGVF